MSLPKFQLGGKVGGVSFTKNINTTSNPLANFGKVIIDNGNVKIPAIMHQDVVSNLKLAIQRESLVGVN